METKKVELAVNKKSSTLSAKRLIGSDLRNREGKKVGKIVDILIGRNKDRRAFLIVDFSDFMATDHSQYAIHSDGFTIDSAGLPVIEFDINEEILGLATGVQEEDAERIREQEQIRDIYVYSGIDKWTL